MVRIAMRMVAIGTAFVIGWIVHMIAMVMTVYDGLLSTVFQPIMAAVCSDFVVGVAIVFGQLLRLRFLSRWWNATSAWAWTLVFGGLFLLCFGYRHKTPLLRWFPSLGHDFPTFGKVVCWKDGFVQINGADRPEQGCLHQGTCRWRIRTRRLQNMKRIELLKHLEAHGRVFTREGGSHSWWLNPAQNKRFFVPRHSEIRDLLARKICRNVGTRFVK